MRRLGEVSSESALYPQQCQGAMWVKAVLMILSQCRQRDKLPWGGKIFYHCSSQGGNNRRSAQSLQTLSEGIP